MSYTRLIQRHGTSVQWMTANPILKEGEIGVDLTKTTYKIGDGITAWNDIPFDHILPSLLAEYGSIIVGAAPGVPGNLPRGAYGGVDGMRLTVNSDGTLAWILWPYADAFETSAHAAATYNATVDQDAAFVDSIYSSDAATTYVSIADEAIAHALLLTKTAAATTYIPPEFAIENYEPKWITVVKALTDNVHGTALYLDSELRFTPDINSTYIFEMYVMYNATYAGGMKVTIGGPTNSQQRFGIHAPGEDLASEGSTNDTYYQGNFGYYNVDPPDSAQVEAPPLSIGAGGADDVLFLTIKGVLHTTATVDGPLVFKFTQKNVVSDAGITVLHGSYLRARKVS